MLAPQTGDICNSEVIASEEFWSTGVLHVIHRWINLYGSATKITSNEVKMIDKLIDRPKGIHLRHACLLVQSDGGKNPGRFWFVA